jgi:hypothetical protein
MAGRAGRGAVTHTLAWTEAACVCQGNGACGWLHTQHLCTVLTQPQLAAHLRAATPLRQGCQQQRHHALQHSSIAAVQPLVKEGGGQGGARCRQRGRCARSQARPAPADGERMATYIYALIEGCRD